MFHFGNAYDSGEDELVVEQIEYPENIYHVFKMPQGKMKDNEAFDKIFNWNNQGSKLCRYTLDLKSSKVIQREVIFDGFCEFPRVVEEEIARKNRNLYFLSGNKEANYFHIVCRYDDKTSKLVSRSFDLEEYLYEPIPFISEGREYVHLLSKNLNDDKNYYRLLDGETFEDVALFALEGYHPLGFHGDFEK